MIEVLPSGRLRVSVYDPRVGEKVNVKDILTPKEMTDLGAYRNTFGTRRAARKAENKATERVGERRTLMTFREWREKVSTDTTFTRGLTEATVKTNYESTKKFADFAGDRTLYEIEHDDRILADYLEWGGPAYSVMAIRAMLNRAKTPAAGKLIKSNPLEKPGIGKSRGRRDRQPPSLETCRTLIDAAHKLTTPSYADFYDFACHTAMRGGEIDGLRWPQVDWINNEVHVVEQWNQGVGKFTAPKYGAYTIALVGKAREILRRRWAQRTSDDGFVFVTLRGTHFTRSNRTHHWNRVRCSVGLGKMHFYLASRHYFGWYGINVLGIAPWILAEQFGHRDGGKLIMETYGHPDRRRLRALIREAHDAENGILPADDDGAPTPTPDGGGVVVHPVFFRRHDDAEHDRELVAA